MIAVHVGAMASVDAPHVLHDDAVVAVERREAVGTSSEIVARSKGSQEIVVVPCEQSVPHAVRALARDIRAPPPALWPEIEHRIGSRHTDLVDEDPVKAGAEEVGLALPDPLSAELFVEIVADHVNHEMTLSGEREAGVVELFLGTFRT